MKKLYIIFFSFILFSCEYFYPPEIYQTLNHISSSVSSLSSVSSVSSVSSLKGIFVSITRGDDLNSGTNISQPVKNINVGIDKAKTYGMTNIYVEAGIYTVGNGGLSDGYEASLELTNVNGINITGGWDLDFIKRVGRSILDNEKNPVYKRVLYISNSFSNTIDGFDFANTSNNSYYFGAGAFIVMSTNITLTNCVIRNNCTPGIEGEALFMLNSLNCRLYLDIVSNTSEDTSIIISISSSSSNYFKGNIIGNYTSHYSPPIFKLISSSYNTIECLFSENGKNDRPSSILYLYYGDGNIIRSRIMNNTCSNYIIQLYYSSNNTISGEIINNGLTDVYYANCAMIFGGESNVIKNLVITNNLVSGTGNLNSVIYISKDYDSHLPVYMISNCIIGNTKSTLCGIFEAGAYDLSGHILKNNLFFGYFYSGYYYDVFSNYIDTIDKLNDTNYTGASEASGNVIHF